MDREMCSFQTDKLSTSNVVVCWWLKAAVEHHISPEFQLDPLGSHWWTQRQLEHFSQLPLHQFPGSLQRMLKEFLGRHALFSSAHTADKLGKSGGENTATAQSLRTGFSPSSASLFLLHGKRQSELPPAHHKN